MKKKALKVNIRHVTEIHIFLFLIGLCIVSRIPFLKTFELVAYDGTAYLNQAKSLFSGHMTGGAFPIGYPLSVAILLVIIRDLQIAGQVVSFLAFVGSALIIYSLAKKLVSRKLALLGAVVMILNPLFIRHSLMTLSESLYIFWLLLGLLMLVNERFLLFGIVMGAAAITRPEAIAIAGFLTLLKIRRLRRFIIILAGFVAVYALNVAVLSQAAGELVLLPKTQLIGSNVRMAIVHDEMSIDFEGKEEKVAHAEQEYGHRNIVSRYFNGFINELTLLNRHILPVIIILAILGMYHKRSRYVAALAIPFLVYPLAGVKGEARFILPYIPAFILLSLNGVEVLKSKRLEFTAMILLGITIIALFAINKAQLRKSIEENMSIPLKEAGLAYRDEVRPGDKIAGRKPYFAFYAGGEFVKIPAANYDETMKYLDAENVKFLSLLAATIHRLRPPLRPLLYNAYFINSEVRYLQTHAEPKGVMVYTRVLDSDPLRWQRLASFDGSFAVPVWSPDGRWIACRASGRKIVDGIYLINVDGGTPLRLCEDEYRDDPIDWSPDGQLLCFAGSDKILRKIDVKTKKVERIETGGDAESPAWCPDPIHIFFSSRRSGQQEIWIINLLTGEPHQITQDGGNSLPAVSGDNRFLSWINNNKRIAVDNPTGNRKYEISYPALTSSKPAWSPNNRYIAVSAMDIQSEDIYIIREDVSNAIILTKKFGSETSPAWSPDGKRLAIVSNQGGKDEIYILSNFEPYLERLEKPSRVVVYREPARE
jgi:TolB protein